MSRLRLGYFADGPWSHRALERLVDDARFEVAFIAPRFDTRDPVLARWSERLGVEFLMLEDINAPASIEQLRRFDADLFVSMSYNQIFKAPAIALPPRGVINCHAGALPFFRGRNILNWALINDAKRFGVTVHDIADAGIDRGDILVQEFHSITDADDYGTLLDRAIEGCAVALLRALDQIASGTLQRTPQSSVHPVGFYCGRRRPGDEWIDWNWDSRRIFNFVRAIAPPGPGAVTLRGAIEVRVLRAEMIEGAPSYLGTPGEVVGADGRGVVVKTGNSTLRLTEVRAADGRPIGMGSRLGLDPLRAVAELSARVRELEFRLATGAGAEEGAP